MLHYSISPLTWIRNGLRTNVRLAFLCIAVCCVIVPYWYGAFDAATPGVPTSNAVWVALILGIPSGLILWFIARLVLFARSR